MLFPGPCNHLNKELFGKGSLAPHSSAGALERPRLIPTEECYKNTTISYRVNLLSYKTVMESLLWLPGPQNLHSRSTGAPILFALKV
jgi:hypothetical protein